MFLTIVISGLWHGSTWNFALWGALHGLGCVADRRLNEESPFYKDRIPRALKTLGVFLFVSFAWIFFRARNLTDARTIITRIARFSWSDPKCPLVLLGLVLAVWLYQAAYESRLRRALRPAALGVGTVVLLILGVALRIRRFAWFDPTFPLFLAGLVLMVWLYQAMYESRLGAVLRIGIMVLLILGVVLFAPSGVRPFIYSQF